MRFWNRTGSSELQKPRSGESMDLRRQAHESGALNNRNTQSREAAKANSSKWMNEQSETKSLLEWQKSYSAFTVSYSRSDSVQNDIRNQKEHHRKKTFQEEYIEFLKRHNIPFQMEYLFEGEHHG